MFFRKQSPPASWTEKKKHYYDNHHKGISKDSHSVTSPFIIITTTLKNISPRLKYTALLSLFLLAWFLILSSRFPLTKNDNKISNPWVPNCLNGTLSVYVYDLPPEFNLGLLQHCRHLNVYTDMCPHVANRGLGQPIPNMGPGPSPSAARPSWFATHQFIAEMIFHARVENHACRTWDPERATLFYVPFYGGLDASSKFREANLTERDALAVRLVDFLTEQNPWWERNQGRDHFIALGRTAWDFMRDPQGPDFGANCLLNLPAVKNTSVLTVERQPWQGYNHHGIPYASYFHPSTWQEMLTWQSKVRSSDRPHLFSFIGGPRKGLEKAAIRDELITQCAGSTRCELLRCGSKELKCHDPGHVIRVMTRSEFCLQAPGDSYTRRSTFDSVLAGCIPVFFSEHTAYSQYRWFLPEERGEYSVFIDERSEASRRIEEELAKIPRERVERMRENVIALIPRLTYAHPNATAAGFEDAVDVALAALAKHVHSKLAAS